MGSPQQSAPVLPFHEARRVVEEHARALSPPASEQVPLAQADGRVLREPVIADRDLPPFNRATRDGYAARAAEVPGSLRIVAHIKAGAPPSAIQIEPGTCAEIMTGAAVPAGADAVVMVEYTAAQGDSVDVQRGATAGENVVPRGSEAQQGAVLLESGTRIRAAEVALLASVGRSGVPVARRPTVAILATGDEVMDVEAAPGPHQIRNSNSHSLAAMARAAGGEPRILPVAPDDPQRLRALLAQGLKADLLLISGGVSAGKHDYVEPELKALGAEFFFTGALIQPGRPIVFGRAGKTCFFGLPGNPISTIVCFALFVRPMIEGLLGAHIQPPVIAQARLVADIKTKPGLTRFLPARLSGGPEGAQVEQVKWQGSGDLVALSRANCYVVVPAEREGLQAGEMVSVFLA